MASLLLADDHGIIRTGLKLIIESFMPGSRMDEAHDGVSTFEKIREHSYDLLVLDINMPGTDAHELVTGMLGEQPGLKICMFSMNDEEVYARRYLKSGVMGYVQKDQHPDEIKKAIITILDNKKYISPRLRQVLIGDLDANNPENPFDSLSSREFEIARHLLLGRSIAWICRKLALHPSTVGTYKARVFQKVHCSNIIELNSLAKAYNMISRS